MNDKKNENIDPNNFFDLQALAETASYLTYSRFMQRICLGEPIFWIDAITAVSETIAILLDEFTPEGEELTIGIEPLAIIAEAAFAEINLAQGDLFLDRIDHAPPMFEQPSSDEFEDPDFEE